MADNDHFYQLAMSLSLPERMNLLEKLKGFRMLSPDPLYIVDKETESPPDTESQYFRLPWYFRFWYFLLGFFRGKMPEKIYEERQIFLLGQFIREHTEGLFDYQSGKLLPGFYSRLENLRTASRFFYTALDSGFNTDKGAFYAFLGSLEMEPIHSRLQIAVNPGAQEVKNPDASESEIRQILLRAVEDALRGITDVHRVAMYQNARILYCLKELAFFPYDRLFMAFNFDLALNGYACPIHIIKEMLSSLANILFSLKTIPSMTLLESLFVFILQERAGEPGFDINAEIRALLLKAEESLGVIRDFNKKVPLAKILRCTARNKPGPPREISGGEDWYTVYREYWRRQGEEQFAFYVSGRRKGELDAALHDFFGGKPLLTLGNTESEINPDGFPLKGALGLSFLLVFYSAVFMPDCYGTLRAILVEGEFNKKENRQEFEKSFGLLIKLEDMILALESRLAPSGDYGRAYVLTRQEISSLAIKRRKIQVLTGQASLDAAAVLEEAREAVKGMIDVLGGILGKDTKEYFSLFNLSGFEEKYRGFINTVNKITEKFQKTFDILEEIGSLEAGTQPWGV